MASAASASGRSRLVRLRDMERMGRKAVLLESALPELDIDPAVLHAMSRYESPLITRRPVIAFRGAPSPWRPAGS